MDERLLPPALQSTERETLLATLQYLRDSFMSKFDGLTLADAERPMVTSGTSLLWLARHLALAEHAWIVRRGTGAPQISLAGTGPDALTEALAEYRATWVEVDEVIAAHSLDDELARYRDQGPVNLRWVIVHLIDEVARHAGHADILRELIDGAVGR